MAQSEIRKIVAGTTVICKAGGCFFSKEYEEKLDKVIAGVNTLATLVNEQLVKINRLRNEHSEMFAGRQSKSLAKGLDPYVYDNSSVLINKF